jgi:hypothetical protein
VTVLFVGEPVKSASLVVAFVHAAVPESQFSVEVSQTPLFVPDHVCDVAFAEEATLRADRSPTSAAEACRRRLGQFAEEKTGLDGRFFMK